MDEGLIRHPLWLSSRFGWSWTRLVTLLFLTPLFEQLPNVALAALVLVAGIGLFDIPELKRLWRIQRADFVLAIITALSVEVIGMLPGILIAVVPSLLDVARRSSWPHTAVLVRVPGTHRFLDTDRVEDGELIPGLVIYRFDAPLFFANASIMAGERESLVEKADAPVERILVDAESITDVDTTGVQTLEELLDDLDELGVTLALARLRNAVRAVLDSTGRSNGSVRRTSTPRSMTVWLPSWGVLANPVRDADRHSCDVVTTVRQEDRSLGLPHGHPLSHRCRGRESVAVGVLLPDLHRGDHTKLPECGQFARGSIR